MGKEEGRISKMSELLEKYQRISVVVQTNEREEEYLKSLREWERCSKKSDTLLSGPIPHQ